MLLGVDSRECLLQTLCKSALFENLVNEIPKSHATVIAIKPNLLGISMSKKSKKEFM